jgi:hypothetical protein
MPNVRLIDGTVHELDAGDGWTIFESSESGKHFCAKCVIAMLPQTHTETHSSTLEAHTERVSVESVLRDMVAGEIVGCEHLWDRAAQFDAEKYSE